MTFNMIFNCACWYRNALAAKYNLPMIEILKDICLLAEYPVYGVDFNQEWKRIVANKKSWIKVSVGTGFERTPPDQLIDIGELVDSIERLASIMKNFKDEDYHELRQTEEKLRGF